MEAQLSEGSQRLSFAIVSTGIGATPDLKIRISKGQGCRIWWLF